MDEKEVHVIPNGDLREHAPSQDCWCHPSPDDDCPVVWVHHSMDERESYEQGRKLQ